MSKLIYVLNGPNLNLLGQREPHIYGHETLADVQALCENAAKSHGFDIRFLQSNAEHQLIDWIHEARLDAAGIVINPAAFTHTSVALHDALAAFNPPIIEIHISNVHRREAYRHHSYVSSVAEGVICGCGTMGYRFAVERVIFLAEAALPAN